MRSHFDLSAKALYPSSPTIASPSRTLTGNFPVAPQNPGPRDTVRGQQISVLVLSSVPERANVLTAPGFQPLFRRNRGLFVTTMPAFRFRTSPFATSRPIRGVLSGFVVATSLLLAACGTPTPKPSSPRATLSPSEQGAACMIGLSYTNSAFNRLKDTGNGNGCGIGSAVSLVATESTLSRPAEMDCGLALRYARFDSDVIQPLAQELFGQGVRVVHHYGSYVCRGRTSDSRRLSEHAYGKALDLGVFELTDGDKISVSRHWRGSGAKSEFLQRVARAACDHFNVVLSPNSDKDHQDHIHVDIGPWKKCGT